MKSSIFCWILYALLLFPIISFSQSENNNQPIAIVIHGGAGNINPQNIGLEEQKRIKNVLKFALDTGYRQLKNGATSLDVVEMIVKILEGAPEFNAGKGAVFNSEGKHELDASIMDGSSLNAGAVSGVMHIKNPISAARIVMEHSRHVLLNGEGAENFVEKFDLETVDNEYFDTDKRKKQFDQIKVNEGEGSLPKNYQKFGTVGCVVLDQYGNIAAGTSTGGLTNKQYGRIGDSPIIGAGTYANNKTCGISSTGVGEYFMRGVVAYDISALMEYKNYTLEKAAKAVVMEKLKEMGGDGGIIGLDKGGNISMVFNTEGMIRGFVGKDGNTEVKLFAD